MTGIAARRVVLADTGPFCRLAEAGEVHLDAAANFLKDKVQVVLDVHQELRRRAAIPEHARLNRLETLGVPAAEPIGITDSKLLSDIEEIRAGRRRHKPGHRREDLGEIATALVAAVEKVPVLMDDGFGKNLAAQRHVEVFTTQDLAVELTARDLLQPIHGFGIYRLVYRGAAKPEFDDRVAAFRKELGP